MGVSMKHRPGLNQAGVSLVGLIIVVAIIGVIAVLGMKVVPTAIEYQSIKKAIASAKNAGTNEREIRTAFDKSASAGYIDTLKGSDLDITKVDNTFEVSFAYEKKIPLFGPASLLIDYEGSTARNSLKKAATQKNK